MKVNIVSRFIVVAATILGTVVVATSQPGLPSAQISRGNDSWPEHSIIPDKVAINQMQEFKDTATLHLNDMLQNYSEGSGPQLRGKKTKFNETTIIHTSVFMGAINDTLVRYKEWSGALVGSGSGPGKPPTAAELAVLYYVFDKGIDNVGRVPGSTAAAEGGKYGITAHISPKDMGMTPDQFKQMCIQYCEASHGRFWRDAASGLASGR